MCSVGALAGNLFAAAPFTFSYTAGNLGSVRFNHTASIRGRVQLDGPAAVRIEVEVCAHVNPGE